MTTTLTALPSQKGIGVRFFVAQGYPNPIPIVKEDSVGVLCNTTTLTPLPS